MKYKTEKLYLLEAEVKLKWMYEKTKHIKSQWKSIPEGKKDDPNYQVKPNEYESYQDELNDHESISTTLSEIQTILHDRQAYTKTGKTIPELVKHVGELFKDQYYWVSKYEQENNILSKKKQ